MTVSKFLTVAVLSHLRSPRAKNFSFYINDLQYFLEPGTVPA